MRMYIKSLDERAWLAVLDGWRPPRIPEENPRDPQIPEERLKPERDWTTEERVESNFNSKASLMQSLSNARSSAMEVMSLDIDSGMSRIGRSSEVEM